ARVARRCPARRHRPIRQPEPLSGVRAGGASGAAAGGVMEAVVLALLQTLTVAVGAPLMVGTLRTLKARLVGRRGPAPWQPFLDVRNLSGNARLLSERRPWFFAGTPYVLPGARLVGARATPVLPSRPPLAFAGIILLMSLFLLGTFFLALAGLDAGSA